MANEIKAIRRVVTGNDAHGRSRVVFDSAAPNVNPGAIRPGTCMTDVWVYESCPATIDGANAFSSPVHKSETVDYGILLEGERVLVLDSGEYVMKPGDVVVQLGNWHGWTNPREGSLMAFVMMGAKFAD